MRTSDESRVITLSRLEKIEEIEEAEQKISEENANAEEKTTAAEIMNTDENEESF